MDRGSLAATTSAMPATTPQTSTMSLREAMAKAVALFREGRYTQAERIGREVLTASPGHLAALRVLGLALAKQRRPQEALEAYDRALAIRPHDARTLNNRAVALRELARSEAALQSCEQAIALEPDYAEAWHNRGSVLGDLGRTEEALQCYDRAVALEPSFAEAHFNRGNALRDLERYDAAVQSYDQAIALRPSYTDAIFNRGLISLVRGDLRAGWAAYESRWDRAEADLPRRAFPEPLWLGGDPIDGRIILLHAEQGLGDTLQFVRYAPLLARRGATVHLEVQPALKSLLRPLPGVEAVFARGEALPAFDAHCPLMSLPLAFGTTLETIPARIPYVSAPRTVPPSGRNDSASGPASFAWVWCGRATRRTRTTGIARSRCSGSNPCSR